MIEQKIRTLIVEDEEVGRQALARLLGGDPDVEVIGICSDGRQAVEAIRSSRPDLVFLDVQMPELNGLQVVEKVGPEAMPRVVFVTAFDQYTLRAFEIQAIDYLLKPFDEERFETALRRAKHEIELERQWKAQKRDVPTNDRHDFKGMCRIPIKTGGKTVFVDLDQIDYIEACGNYVRMHVGKQEYVTRETMSSVESTFSGSNFVRIHRSIIVNRRRIKELRPWFTGEYIILLTTGKELTLSRGFRDRLSSLLAPV